MDTVMNSTALSFCCAYCGTPSMKFCAGCRSVRYCSRICQRNHWIRSHKYQCDDLNQWTIDLTSIFGKEGRAFGSGDASSAVLQTSNKVEGLRLSKQMDALKKEVSYMKKEMRKVDGVQNLLKFRYFFMIIIVVIIVCKWNQII